MQGVQPWGLGDELTRSFSQVAHSPRGAPGDYNARDSWTDGQTERSGVMRGARSRGQWGQGARQYLVAEVAFGLDPEGMTGRRGGGHPIAKVWRQELLWWHPRVLGGILCLECRGTGDSWRHGLRSRALDSGDRLWLHHLPTVSLPSVLFSSLEHTGSSGTTPVRWWSPFEQRLAT